MTKTVRLRSRLGIAVALLALSTIVVACGSSGGSDASDTTAAAGSDTTAAAAADAPDTITIGYQAIPNGDLVVKHEKYLEKAFPDTKIEWKLFDSGGSVNEAVVAGSIDFGLAGSSPVSRGLSQPIKYQVPWIHDVIGKAEALVVKSDITSIADLKGKKIATPFASTSHYSLLAALADAGVDDKDVKIIDAEPDDIYAAWSRGDIDGAYVWNPNLAKIISDGGHTLITSADLAEKGKTTYDLAVVTNDFASKYPDAVTTWVKAQDQAVKLIKSDVDAAAKDIAAELSIDEADAKAQIGDLIFLTAAEQATPEYLGGGLATNLYSSAQFNKDQGKIDTVAPESTYTAGVVETFAKNAG